MLKDRQKNLIMAVINNNPLRAGKISDDVFLNEYPAENGDARGLVSKIINNSLQEKDALGVEYALYLGFHFGFSKDQKNLLISLIYDLNHQRHNDVVMALESLKFKSNDVVDAFYYGATSNFEYLKGERENGSYMLNWNCIFSLAKIGSDYATKKLENLMKSETNEIKEKAQYVMKKYGLKTD